MSVELNHTIVWCRDKQKSTRFLMDILDLPSPVAFGQMLVRRLFRESNVLTQVSGNNFVVLKAAPPLIVTHAQVDQFVDGVTAAALGLGS